MFFSQNTMASAVQYEKDYRSHLLGIIFSRPYFIVTLFIMTLRWWTGAPPVSPFSLFLAVLSPLPVLALIVFMDHDPLPKKYWFENELLVVEDASGDIRRYVRWVKVGRLGLHTIYAQSPGKVLRIYEWAFLPVPLAQSEEPA